GILRQPRDERHRLGVEPHLLQARQHLVHVAFKLAGSEESQHPAQFLIDVSEDITLRLRSAHARLLFMSIALYVSPSARGSSTPSSAALFLGGFGFPDFFFTALVPPFLASI